MFLVILLCEIKKVMLNFELMNMKYIITYFVVSQELGTSKNYR